ncbi:cupin domain-containing protein [Ruficoccus amylovorans]|uniref:Cupin domain-containing protein n=1 Tax=Ruficoccus amylovorans TaxID=1804625 RepID=A0A842HGE3_9BACT|nr:cupin domain-containing protein [Ruficoccus amylovorans]MBC2594321.1 cupin domain-containing protein [Ruficoccus amylovorans]
MDAPSLIHLLKLESLPDEGGFFRRVHTHPQTVPGTDRPLSTCIYYLVTGDGFSAMHRVDAEETFHFHAGDPVEMLQLHPTGLGEKIRLGSDPTAGELPFAAVTAGTWQGCRLAPGGSAGYALFTTTVSPGFVWKGFELGSRAVLASEWPEWTEDITALTRH